MQHLSEVAHILRAALNNDHDRVRAYAELLITKLHEDGEDRQANVLHTVLYPSLEDVGKRITPTGGSEVRHLRGGEESAQDLLQRHQAALDGRTRDGQRE